MKLSKKIKASLRNIFNGSLIGIVNPIPGVSGGTIMVLLGIFDDITSSVSNLFSKNKKTNFKDLTYLIEIFLGCAIGVVVFSKIIQFLYTNYLPQTMFWFSGLVLFSVPILIKNEIGEKKIDYKYFFIGILIILIIYLFSRDNLKMNNINTNLTLISIIEMFFIGFISGAATIFPGISGSMVLLLIGKYYTYNYYLAMSTTLSLDIIIPLIFILIGILIGAICSSKVSYYLIKKYKIKTMSLIIGFVFISSLVIIPFDYKFDLITFVTSIITFFIGGYIVTLLHKLKK